MANITQTIPALTAGISQQPDEQKIPGQVKDMVNALPDVTQGLTKDRLESLWHLYLMEQTILLQPVNGSIITEMKMNNT